MAVPAITHDISFSHKIDGEFVAAESVTLSDETNTFGVRAVSSGEVVVPPGTPMMDTSSPSGYYTARFRAFSGVAYEASIRVQAVAGGPAAYYTRLFPQIQGDESVADFLDDRKQSYFQRGVLNSEAAENLVVAIEWIEAETNRMLPLTSRTVSFDQWPTGRVTLWPCPLHDIEAVRYLDTSGNEQQLFEPEFRAAVRRSPGWIELGNGALPSLYLGNVTERVWIDYRVGHANLAEAPPTLLAAARILASGLYENREPSSPVQLHEVPMGVRRLLDLNRIVRLEGE
ncbi:MAG: hypothetical protein AAF561_00110 [Planctomycetota bacterium]